MSIRWRNTTSRDFTNIGDEYWSLSPAGRQAPPVETIVGRLRRAAIDQMR